MMNNMESKSNKNNRKPRKRAVKKQEPTLQEQIEQNLKEAREQMRQSEIIRKQAEELLKKMERNRPNYCKTCLFQKMCSKFTEDGRNGFACSFAPYNERIKGLIKKGDGVVYDSKLIYWKDSQEQLDNRFILS